MGEMTPSVDPDRCEKDVLLNMRSIYSFQTSQINCVAVVTAVKMMSLKTMNNTGFY